MEVAERNGVVEGILFQGCLYKKEEKQHIDGTYYFYRWIPHLECVLHCHTFTLGAHVEREVYLNLVMHSFPKKPKTG